MERIKAILLHEVLTELLIAYRLNDLLLELNDYIKKLHVGFGLETRNLGQLNEFLKEMDYFPEYIMTPANPLGYQMAPSKKAAEIAIMEVGTKSKIIDISILAAGAITLEEAMGYVHKINQSLYAVVSATSNPLRARENFKILSSLLTEHTQE